MGSVSLAATMISASSSSSAPSQDRKIGSSDVSRFGTGMLFFAALTALANEVRLEGAMERADTDLSKVEVADERGEFELYEYLRRSISERATLEQGSVSGLSNEVAGVDIPEFWESCKVLLDDLESKDDCDALAVLE